MTYLATKQIKIIESLYMWEKKMAAPFGTTTFEPMKT